MSDVTLDIARSKIILVGFPSTPAKTPGTIDLTTTSLSAQSGDSVTVQVARSGGSDGPISATIKLSDNRSANVNWDNGETGTKDAVFTMAQGGTFDITLTAIGAVVGVSSGVITVAATHPGTLNLTSLNQSVIAGQPIVVTVSRDNGTDGLAAVTYTLSSGATGTLNWADGIGGSKSASIPTDVNSLPGTVTITLSAVQGATLGVASGNVTLIASSSTGVVDLITTSVSVIAGADATITFARSNGNRGQATANYSLSDGTTGSIIWADGVSGSRSETIPTQAAEAGTTLTVSLDSVDGADKGVATGTITIKAPVSPGAVQFTQATFAATRGTVSVLLAERVNGTDGPITVAVNTADGTAFDGIDYNAISTTLNWGDGETGTKVIQIQTLGQVVAPEPGTIQLKQSTYAVNAGAYAPIVLQRIGGKAGAVSVTIDTFDGSARVGTDFSNVHTAVNWGDGDAADKTVDITTLLNAPPPSSTGVSAVVTLTSPSAEVLHIDDAPLGVSALKKSNNTDHADLAICVYDDCVVFENCYPDSAGDYQGRLQVAVDGTSVFDQTGVFFWKLSRTRPIRQGFTQITPTRNFDPTMIPSYNVPTAGLHSFLSYYNGSDNGINGNGISSAYTQMSGVGGREQIGILPGHDLPWLLVGGGDNWTVVRGTADAAAIWPMHVRDRATGNPLDQTQWGGVTTLDVYLGKTIQGHVNPIDSLSSNPHTPDSAHTTGCSFAAYLSTGSDYDADEMAFWGMFNFMQGNPSYQKYQQCILAGQVRAVAWGLRSLFYCAKLLPSSHPLKSSFDTILANNFGAYWTNAHAPGATYNNRYGIWLTNTVWAYGNQSGQEAIKNCGMAPWQDDFITSVINHGVRMGFTQWSVLRDFKALFTLTRMTTWNYQMATFYECWLRDTAFAGLGSTGATPDQLLGPTQYEAQELQYTYNGQYAAQIPNLDPNTGVLSAADALAAFGTVVHGDTGGALSFPANMQPALAAAVDANLPGAQSAWNNFEANTSMDYTSQDGNQFNIVPQT